MTHKKTKKPTSGLRMTARLSNVGYRLDGEVQSYANYETFVGDPDRPCRTVIAPILAILLQETSYSCAENMRSDFLYLKNYVAGLDVEAATAAEEQLQSPETE